MSTEKKPDGQSCGGCAWFSDHRCDDDDPDEVDGYCGYDGHVDYGPEYGCHWTHHDAWCAGWKPEPPRSREGETER